MSKASRFLEVELLFTTVALCYWSQSLGKISVLRYFSVILALGLMAFPSQNRRCRVISSATFDSKLLMTQSVRLRLHHFLVVSKVGTNYCAHFAKFFGLLFCINYQDTTHEFKPVPIFSLCSYIEPTAGGGSTLGVAVVYTTTVNCFCNL